MHSPGRDKIDGDGEDDGEAARLRADREDSGEAR
jgi:hypothetical protein